MVERRTLNIEPETPCSLPFRAKMVKPQEMIDTRYHDEMEKSGFFEQIWARRR